MKPVHGASAEPRNSPKLALKGIAKTFAGPDGVSQPVLSATDLSVEANTFVSIVGPSGCGKSTLLNIVAGLETADAGTVAIDGRAPQGPGRGVAYMFQKDLLLPWRRIRENVSFGIEIKGEQPRRARERADALLERFGLAAFRNHYPGQLSGGMRQRVALMRTLICDSDILLLDEPFGALDALTRSTMQQWLLEIWMADRRTVVFVTHDIDEAIFLSDRVLVMSARPGRIKMDLDVDLPRPRHHHLLTDPRFAAIKRSIVEELYSEIRGLDEG